MQIMIGSSGAKLQLKADSEAEGRRWEQHIFERLDWLQHEKQLQEEALRYAEEVSKKGTVQTDMGEPVAYAGWLKKKSPKKYAGLQVM